MSVVIRPEADRDQAAIWNVNQAAFEGDAEANLVDALRDGGFVEVSLVGEVDGQVVGHILFSRVKIITKAGTADALSLAPMAMLPSHQRKGIGSMLVWAGLDACQERGHRIVLVLGYPEFYREFGFSAQLAERLESLSAGCWCCSPGEASPTLSRRKYIKLLSDVPIKRPRSSTSSIRQLASFSSPNGKS